MICMPLLYEGTNGVEAVSLSDVRHDVVHKLMSALLHRRRNYSLRSSS